MALIALIALPTLPAMPVARSDPRPAEKASVVEETHEPTAKANGVTRASAYEKPALNKLTIEGESPEEPAPLPKPERKPQKKEPEGRVRAGATSVDVLPGPARKVAETKPPTRKPPEQKPPEQKPAERKAPVQRAPGGETSKARPSTDAERRKPRDTSLLLTDTSAGDRGRNGWGLPRPILPGPGGDHAPLRDRLPLRTRLEHLHRRPPADYDASRVPSVFRNLKSL